MKSIALDAMEKADGNEKCGYLNVTLRCIQAEVALLQDGGPLPRALRRMELTGADGGPIPLLPVPPAQVTVIWQRGSEPPQIDR